MILLLVKAEKYKRRKVIVTWCRLFCLAVVAVLMVLYVVSRRRHLRFCDLFRSPFEALPIKGVCNFMGLIFSKIET